jgi:hypothetical protein
MMLSRFFCDAALVLCNAISVLCDVVSMLCDAAGRWTYDVVAVQVA